MMRGLAYHVVKTIETKRCDVANTDSCFKIVCHGFRVFDKAVRPNAAYSLSHDHVEGSIIVAPSFRRREATACPES